jgi:signal-transduction protein with cAMP-binding, CBS, and nucleotidyltransferase domain
MRERVDTIEETASIQETAKKMKDKKVSLGCSGGLQDVQTTENQPEMGIRRTDRLCCRSILRRWIWTSRYNWDYR